MIFSSEIQEDLNNVVKILKNKLNFAGFHEIFKSIKRIGRGNFASVILFMTNFHFYVKRSS